MQPLNTLGWRCPDRRRPIGLFRWGDQALGSLTPATETVSLYGQVSPVTALAALPEVAPRVRFFRKRNHKLWDTNTGPMTARL